MLTIKEIVSFLDGNLIGDPEFIIKGVCDLKGGKKNCISYLDNPKYIKYLNDTKASAIIIDSDYDIQNSNKIYIRVENPKISFAKLLSKFKVNYSIAPQISNTAQICKTAVIGKNVHIGHNVVIKKDVEIFDNAIIKSGTVILENCKIGFKTYIGPNTTLYSDTILGNNVHIDAGCVLGADGFGWSTLDNKQIKVPQIGNVIIENDVWIGANCCIDRSTLDSTIIGKGTKMDNLIQIGHNVIIGKNCLISGGTAIGGSTNIGNNVIIAGQVGIIDHLNIGDNSIIAAKSGVFKSFGNNSFISGTPARHHSDRLRQDILITKLPNIQKKINNIENILKDKDNTID